jgi:hypothetical protein
MIYEASTHASPTLLHFLVATLIPTKHRIRIGSSMERYAPEDSLTRAILAWGATVGVGLVALKLFGNINNPNHRHHHLDGMVQESLSSSSSSSAQSRKLSLWAILTEMMGIKRDRNSNDSNNRIDGSSRSLTSRKNSKRPPPPPKSLFHPFSPHHDVEEEDDDVIHQGSCHCGAITFEVSVFGVVFLSRLTAQDTISSCSAFPCSSYFILLAVVVVVGFVAADAANISYSI